MLAPVTKHPVPGAQAVGHVGLELRREIAAGDAASITPMELLADITAESKAVDQKDRKCKQKCTALSPLEGVG